MRTKAAGSTKNIPKGSSYFLMDTPRNSPRNSPRGSPRNSPCNSPRNSPRGSPRILLKRNIRVVKYSNKKAEKDAKELRLVRAFNNALIGMTTKINGIIYTKEYIYAPFSRPGALEPENIIDRESSLQFDEPSVSSTITVGDIIRVHSRSKSGKACSAIGGDIFRFEKNAPERNIMIVSDPAGQLVYLDASLLCIYRA